MANTYNDTDWSADANTKGSATSSTTQNVSLDGTLTVAGATQLNSTLSVGVNDTGYDVKFFGATSGKYMEWDESSDQLDVTGSLDVTGNTSMIGTLTVGVDDTGHDVKFFGATSGSYMLWDESLDNLVLTGVSRFGIGTTAPASQLHVVSSTNEKPTILVEKTGSANEDGGNIQFRLKEDGGFIDNGKEIGDLQWYSYDNIDGDYNASAMIRVTASGTQAQNRAGGEMSFWTNSDDTSTSKRMTIDSDGSIGIGTATPSTLLHIVGSTTNALVTIESTGTTSDDAAPELVLKRNADLTDGGNVGVIRFNGLDDGANETIYSSIYSEINDETNTTEDGNLYIQNMIAGTLTNVLSIVKDDVTIAGDLTAGLLVAKTYSEIPLSSYEANATSGNEYYMDVGLSQHSTTTDSPAIALSRIAMNDLVIKRIKIGFSGAINNVTTVELRLKKYDGSGNIEELATQVGTTWTITSSNVADDSFYYHAPSDWVIEKGEKWGITLETTVSSGSISIRLNGNMLIENDYSDLISS